MADFQNKLDYHPRRKDREITDAAKLLDILKTGKYLVVAMCLNNEPYIVTLSYGYDEDKNALYLHCAGEGQKLDFLRSNPYVCATIIIDKGYVSGECSHNYISTVLRGEMVIVKEQIERMHGFEILIKHLEENPEIWQEKLIANNYTSRVEKTTILRLDIANITGKEGR